MTLFRALGLLNPCYNPSYATDERIPLNADEKVYEATDKGSELTGRGTREKHDIIPARWIFAIFGCFGFMAIYGLKVNLSVAIIAMVNHTAVFKEKQHNQAHESLPNSSSQCEENDKPEKTPEDGPFVWDEHIQGLILAAYFYGYIFTQLPGGWLAEKFSAKHVFGFGTCLNAIFTILAPTFAKMSYAWIVVLRIGMGISAGVTLPAMHVLIARWAPPQERSQIASTVYSGMTLGTLVCLPLTGILASDLGWESVFYVQGGLSIIWYILWLCLVFDSPAKHPRISAAERKHIEDSINQLAGGSTGDVTTLPVPWKEIWASSAVWAIIIAHTCCNWGWYIMLMKLPAYMKHILHFNIKANAFLSSIPFLFMWIFAMVFAHILDYLRGRCIITTTKARKFATCVATLLPGVFLVLVTYVGCSKAMGVFFLTLATMFIGGMYPGFLANHIDIAPPFAGTLMGITNTFATLPGIVVPSFVGHLTRGHQTLTVWRHIFVVTLVILSIGAAIYCWLASGEQQSWAKVQNTEPEQKRFQEEPEEEKTKEQSERDSSSM